MLSEDELQEYLDQIRQDVCVRCAGRPAGGPPCAPLGKPCGIELRLSQLIETVQEMRNDLDGPYLAGIRRKVCPLCPVHGQIQVCPCPPDGLTHLIIQAIETVDERRELRERLVELWGD
jgi:hypothetical protein